jgi:KipI family sensor histidine kinase inhibitor
LGSTHNTDSYPRFLPVGDAALSIEFGDTITPHVGGLVSALDSALADAAIAGLMETVPSYRSLLACYDPDILPLWRLVAKIVNLLRQDLPAPGPGISWTVPVSYDCADAVDLDSVAQRLGMSAEAVVATHSTAPYRVYAIGFLPGMPYLGKLPDMLRIPRREAPRAAVPAGAVMIAGEQGLIMPVEAPSGWHAIGRTPLKAFDMTRITPFLFKTGDTVRFRPIDAQELARLERLSQADLISLAREMA